MKQILGFLMIAIKWLARPALQIKTDQQDTKYVLLTDAENAIELAYFHWLRLSKDFWVITRAKRSEPFHVLHRKIEEVMQGYSELAGFDLKSGNPFFHLMDLKAMTRNDLIAKHGDKAVCIHIDLLRRLVTVIITYNFFKKYKERARDPFAKAEAEMRQLVEEKRLPGRFSWNAFVIKDEKEKQEQDYSILDLYGSPSEPAQEEGKEDEKKVSDAGDQNENNSVSNDSKSGLN